jgi:hypothetical protein
MAKSLLSTKGKKKTVRKTKSENYLVNWKYLGDEPKVGINASTIELVRAFTWYNTMCENEEARTYLKDYFKNDNNKDIIKLIDRIPEKRLPLTSAWMCRIASNNKAHLKDNEWKRVTEDIKTTSGYGEEVVDKPTEPKVKPSIQERIKERVSDIIGDVEAILDSGEQVNIYEWLQKNEIPAQHANRIAEFYRPLRAEYSSAITEDDEGYTHYSKSELKAKLAYVTKLIEDCERFAGNVKKARAPRKKKAPTTEKLLKHFQYQKESNEYKLQSCDPATIIGAQELWVFNTKYKTLGVFRARGPSGLNIRRTSIDGYDSDASLIKRVGRKPEEYVKKVLTGGKIILRKLMDEIKSEPITFSDRINNNVILLKVVR